MIVVLRWLAIPPAMVTAWYVALFLGLGLRAAAIRACPAEAMVSGMCMAPWYVYVEGGIIAGSAGIAAALIIAVSVLLAPSNRITVASVVLVGGVVVAFYMAYASGAWSSFGGALVVGVIAWSVVVRWAPVPRMASDAL